VVEAHLEKVRVSSGGRSVAKILVADDNSNIQKMVGLALKEQGIEVVAVGNGEAAVRKISEIRPDLVLADVFMPVRNGYEVCQYVKSDASLAHIPVILLVGAFDPLDEQEAQRVGADGVLKKPFVPPDPLISMVKSALARAGVLPSEKPAAAPPIQAADMISRPRISAPTIGVIPAFEEQSSNGDSQQYVSRLPEPVRIDSGSPLAFGNLLETPVVKEEEEVAGFVPDAHPELAPERDWRSGDETEEVEEEEERKASWRRGGANEALEDSTVVSNARDWRDATFAEASTRQSSRESWEPTKEKTAIVEEEEEQVSVATKEDFSAPTPISVTKPVSAPAPFAGDAWAAAISAGSGEERTAAMVTEAATEAAVVPTEVANDGAAATAEAVVEQAEPAEEPSEIPASSSAESWFSPAPNPWDAELKKAAELSSGWDAPAASVAAAGPMAVVETPAEAAAQEAGLSSATVEAIREEAAIVTESATAGGAESAVAVPPDAARDVPEAVAARIAEPNMDDLVAKVLAKMSPEVLQAVTREILKPVVEAMVRDELNSRKS
jgi:CheY-like chemotaxis protein